MKRIWLLFLIFLLCGCTAAQQTPTQPQAEQVLTMQPWDAEGVLSELVPTIPGGNAFSGCLGFRGNILLWTVDSHRQEECILEFCLIDPAKGTVAARREVTMPHAVQPQVYEDALYLCDPESGTVVELDRSLEITGEWTVPVSAYEDATWYAANRKLWEFACDQPLRCLALGEVYWSEEDARWTEIRRSIGSVDQHRLSGGIVSFSSGSGDALRFYALDLTEGTVITPPQGYERYYRSGNVWLGGREESDYGISVGGGTMRQVIPLDGTLSLLPEGYLLEKSPGDQYLRLYDREGRCISVCRMWERHDGHVEDLIWNNALGGYVIHYRPSAGGSRLLFWDIQKGTGGADLQVQPIQAQ